MSKYKINTKVTGDEAIAEGRKYLERNWKFGTVVIDAYYYGVNGWTFSYTYPNMKIATGAEEVKDIYDCDESQEYLLEEVLDGFKNKEYHIYVPRHTGEYPEPEQYLNVTSDSECQARIDAMPPAFSGSNA